MAVKGLKLSEILFQIVQELGEDFANDVAEYWEKTAPTYNPGQERIFAIHKFPVIENFLGEVGENWPYVEAVAYAEELMFCYNPEVMWRAFSSSIYSPIEDWEERIAHALNIQFTAEYLAAMGL